MNFSVVIPSLNSEKEIEHCLASLMPQLTSQDEVLIIDGGSGDRTLEIAHKYGCRIFIYPEASLGASRNFGVEVAKNGIIVQTDSDVFFPDGFIEALKKYYEDNPDLVAATCGWRDGKGRLLGNFTCAVLEGVLQYADCFQSYRREAYYRTQGHPNVSFGEQIGLWLQLKNLGLTVYDPSLYVYHLSDRNVSIPSYLIAGTLLASGAAYEAGIGGAVGSALLGAGAGFGLGQLGVDLGINKDAPPDHFHHFHLGLMIIAVAMSFGDVLGDDVEAALYGFGSALVVHDVLTESTV
jgi:hypothetical protein